MTPLPVSASVVDYHYFIKQGLPDNLPFQLPQNILPEHYSFAQRVAGELLIDLQNNASRTPTRTFLFNLLSRSGYQNPDFNEVFLFLLDFLEAWTYFKGKDLLSLLPGCVSETTLIYASKYLLDYQALQNVMGQDKVNNAQYNLNKFNKIKTDILEFKRIKGANMYHNPNQQYPGQYTPVQAQPTQPIRPQPPQYGQQPPQYAPPPQYYGQQQPPQYGQPQPPQYYDQPPQYYGQPQYAPPPNAYGVDPRFAGNQNNFPRQYNNQQQGGFYSQNQPQNNPVPNARVIRSMGSNQPNEPVLRNDTFGFNPHERPVEVRQPVIEQQRPVVEQVQQPLDPKAQMTLEFKKLLFPNEWENILLASELTYKEKLEVLKGKIPMLYNYKDELSYFKIDRRTGEVSQQFHEYTNEDKLLYMDYIEHETKYVAPNLSFARTAGKRVIENWEGFGDIISTGESEEVKEAIKKEVVVVDNGDMVAFSESQLIALAKTKLNAEQKRKVNEGATLQIVGKLLHPFYVDVNQTNDVERFVGSLRNTNDVEELKEALVMGSSMTTLPGGLVSTINEYMTNTINDILSAGFELGVNIDDFMVDFDDLLDFLDSDTFTKNKFEQILKSKLQFIPGRRGNVLFGDQVKQYSDSHKGILNWLVDPVTKPVVLLEPVQVVVLAVGSNDSSVVLPKKGESGLLTSKSGLGSFLFEINTSESKPLRSTRIKILTSDGYDCYCINAGFSSSGVILYKN